MTNTESSRAHLFVIAKVEVTLFTDLPIWDLRSRASHGEDTGEIRETGESTP